MAVIYVHFIRTFSSGQAFIVNLIGNFVNALFHQRLFSLNLLLEVWAIGMSTNSEKGSVTERKSFHQKLISINSNTPERTRFSVWFTPDRNARSSWLFNNSSQHLPQMFCTRFNRSEKNSIALFAFGETGEN